MLDISISRSHGRHIRNAWIWAAVIITVAVLLTLSGFVAELGNHDPWHANGEAVAAQAAANQPKMH
jgi:hypothetical protein